MTIQGWREEIEQEVKGAGVTVPTGFVERLAAKLAELERLSAAGYEARVEVWGTAGGPAPFTAVRYASGPTVRIPRPTRADVTDAVSATTFTFREPRAAVLPLGPVVERFCVHGKPLGQCCDRYVPHLTRSVLPRLDTKPAEPRCSGYSDGGTGDFRCCEHAGEYGGFRSATRAAWHKTNPCPCGCHD